MVQSGREKLVEIYNTSCARFLRRSAPRRYDHDALSIGNLFNCTLYNLFVKLLVLAFVIRGDFLVLVPSPLTSRIESNNLLITVYVHFSFLFASQFFFGKTSHSNDDEYDANLLLSS